MAVKKPRKPRAKKAPTKRIIKSQSNIGKGPNININIDQSKRTKKSGVAAPQRQPQIISTFTPVQAPAPIYNFPLPTNLNPFETVVRATQKPKIQENNELEKPKPKEPEPEDYNNDESTVKLEEVKHKVERKQRERDEREFMKLEDFDTPPNTPLLLMDNNIQTAIKNRPKERKEREEMGQEDILSKVNRERKNDTPLQEEQKKVAEKPDLLSTYNPRVRQGKSNIMTLQLLNEGDDKIKQIKKEIKGQTEEEQKKYFEALGGGNRLQKPDSIMDRLSREELRKKRLEALDKEKFSLEPKES